MTYSIVAIDPSTGDIGIAVASKILAVGAFVPHAKAGVGAIATQSYANLNYVQALELLEQGFRPDQCIEYLISQDPLRDIRQTTILNVKGQIAVFTGSQCVGWAGSYVGNGYSVQGNMLVGEHVLTQMAHTFEQARNAGLNFPEQLLVTLEQGEVVGGDRRGRQSAALLVVRKDAGYGGYNDRWIDLRIDHSMTPVQDLRKALEYKIAYGW